MEVVTKPFECPNEDCSLSFSNEDHLVVHKKKHELSLTLTPTTPFKTLFDQTPTPTRFINALDSAELFQDFNADNPFDATFRRANSRDVGSAHFIIPDSSLIASLPDTSEVLNTPSITLPSEPATPIILKAHFSSPSKQKEKTLIDNTDSLPFSPHEQSSSEKNQNSEKPSTSSSETQVIELNSILENNQSSVVKIAVSKSSVVQTPVITSTGSISALKTNVNCVPTAVVTRQSTTVIPTQATILTEKSNQIKIVQQPPTAVVQSMCVTPMLQLMIKLPDGQTMPVQLPVMSSTPAVATVAQTAQAQIAMQPVITSTANAEIPAANILTNMKLKEMLKLNKKTILAKKPLSSSKVKSRLQTEQAVSSQDFLNEFGLSPPPSPVASSKPGHTGRKRRDTVDSVDEKRKRSLERNRAAATRCREKRKQWITALERKADELSLTNTQLQQEVAQLRLEVSHLKTLLLAHKDCPVTQQQKAFGFEAENEVTYTTIQVITPDDYPQRVPSNSDLSMEDKTEYMEMEVSSVQSSSDLSSSSDTCSFKER